MCRVNQTNSETHVAIVENVISHSNYIVITTYSQKLALNLISTDKNLAILCGWKNVKS
jgi:hypothetical protein